MERKILMTVAALLAAALLSSCAATVQRPASPGGASEAVIVAPATTKHLVLVLEPGPGISRDENWAALREEWVTSLSAIAPQHGLRGTVVDTAPGKLDAGDLLVNVHVKDYRYKSQAARYGLGVMTGNAHLTLDLTYKAPPDGRVIGTRSVSTTSSAWQGIFSAMTPKQVEAVVTDIVETAKPR